MASINTLGLEDLYGKVKEVGKCTPSVFARISVMEDFSKINHRYCESICRLPCEKSYSQHQLDSQEADVVILFSEKSRDERYKSGRQLDDIYESILDYLMRTSFPGGTYKLVYGVKCRPTPAVKKITTAVAKPCFNYTQHEILSAKPKVIISTSTDCLKALGFTKGSVKANLSEILYWNGIPLVVTLHPKVTTMIRQNASGAFWGDDFYEVIRRDIVKASQAAAGLIPPANPVEAIQDLVNNGQIVVLKTIKEVYDVCMMLASLPSTTVISWDTETTSLDPWYEDARFLCHQFGRRMPDGLVYAWVIPLWHRDNVWVDPDDAWTLVRMVLESDVTKVGHHGKFDLKYTKVTKNVDVKNYVFDTLYASHSICSGLQGTYGLKKAVWDWIPESRLGGYEELLFINSEIGDENVDETEYASGAH